MQFLNPSLPTKDHSVHTYKVSTEMGGWVQKMAIFAYYQYKIMLT